MEWKAREAKKEAGRNAHKNQNISGLTLFRGHFSSISQSLLCER
jgi:hypothetical protein